MNCEVAKKEDYKIQNRNYPSCYRYNVLIMLAKRLVNESNTEGIYCQNKSGFDRKPLKRITSA
jgi:hypothetical protein